MVERLEKIEVDVPYDDLVASRRLCIGMANYNDTFKSLNNFVNQYETLKLMMKNSNFTELLDEEGRKIMWEGIDQLRPIYEAYCKVAREQNE